MVESGWDVDHFSTASRPALGSYLAVFLWLLVAVFSTDPREIRILPFWVGALVLAVSFTATLRRANIEISSAGITVRASVALREPLFLPWSDIDQCRFGRVFGGEFPHGHYGFVTRIGVQNVRIMMRKPVRIDGRPVWPALFVNCFADTPRWPIYARLPNGQRDDCAVIVLMFDDPVAVSASITRHRPNQP